MRKLLLLLVCTMLLCGCTKSNIVQPGEETKIADPDFDVKDDVDIDWQQVSTEAEEVFEDKAAYPYSEDFHFMLAPNKKQVMLVWVVSDDFPAEEIGNYAEDLIKKFNDVAATQDFSIETSSNDSYGGLWKRYGMSFGIAPKSTQDDESTWYISGSYEAGQEFVLPDVNEVIQKAKKADESETKTAKEDEVKAESEQNKKAQ